MPGWLKILTLIIPILLILVGTLMAHEIWSFRLDSTETRATVVSVRTDGPMQADTMADLRYWPTLRYSDQSDVEHTAESMQVQAGTPPQIGQQISARYSLYNPRLVRPARTGWAEWQGPVLFIGLGTALALILFGVFNAMDRAILARKAHRT